MKYLVIALCLIYSINMIVLSLESSKSAKIPSDHHIAFAHLLKRVGSRGKLLNIALEIQKSCPNHNIIKYAKNAMNKVKSRHIFLKRALKVKTVPKKASFKLFRHMKLNIYKYIQSCSVASRSKAVSSKIRQAIKRTRKSKKVRKSTLRALKKIAKKVFLKKAKKVNKPKKQLKKKVKISFAKKTRKTLKKLKTNKRISKKTKRTIKKLARKLRKQRKLKRTIAKLKFKCLKGKKKSCRKLKRNSRKLRRNARKLKRKIQRQYKKLRTLCVTKKSKSACSVSKMLNKQLKKVQSTIKKSSRKTATWVVAKELHRLLF